MPKRTDIQKIMIIGSGPIVIGQAGEFDYSASQACKALREEGYEVVVVDSNPSTISTDPATATSAYIEPLNLETLTKIIEKEKPDALLPTMGGQTSLNLGMFLEREGVLKRFGVELIGATESVIAKSVDRLLFNAAMQSIGIPVPKSGLANSFSEGKRIIKEIGFPAVLRSAYTTGGAGGATIYNTEEFERMLAFALETSPVHQTLIEESVLGWKEIEFEVLRDSNDNVSVVTSLENMDPMGVHTGDSIVISPAQTFTQSQLASLTSLAEKVVRAVDVVGVANVQFGINPENGDVVITEINPRISRRSALASKATGLSIASAATRLSVGLALEEVHKDAKPASSATQCVVKMSRFSFDKFPGADETLNTTMKSVGEVMAVGGSFKQALQKAIRSLEIGRYGLGSDGRDPEKERQDMDLIQSRLVQPNAERVFYIRYAIENGLSNELIKDFSHVDSWFIQNIREIVEFENKLAGKSLVGVPGDVLREAKQLGYSDVQLAHLLETTEEQVRQRRKTLGIGSIFHNIGNAKNCFYSTYEQSDNNSNTGSDKKVIIIGSGPNRIGQGVEFDYCCAHGALALKDLGYESIIVNCNPSSVSTDSSMADKIYIEPLTVEDVLSIIEREQPMGVIVQLGGRTALNLAQSLKKAGVPILGTAPEDMRRTDDRQLFSKLIEQLGLKMADTERAASVSEAAKKAERIGYPVLVRSSADPSNWAVEIVYDEASLAEFVQKNAVTAPSQPVIIDKFLEDAVGVDVDAITDGETTVICGAMEHIEQAGVHSGDSACSLPPYSLTPKITDEIKRQTPLIAKALEVRGLINVQFAVKDGQIFVLKVNARASRTVPFVSKATGIAWAEVATKIMLGKSLVDQGITKEAAPGHVSVKEAVFPFSRFPGVDVVLGPEMKSTGEVMGINTSFGHAYIKAQISAGQNLQQNGTVFLSVADRHKGVIAEIARGFVELGYGIVATRGTAELLKQEGISAKTVAKIGEGRPDATDLIKNGEINLIINTTSGKKPRKHEISIRSAIVASGIPIITTIAGAKATLTGMNAVLSGGSTVRSLQEYDVF